jgi:import inner membrane translocase subunit TIM50
MDRVKTLVLDLDDLLVHKEWTRQAGWKVFKRPGVQV